MKIAISYRIFIETVHHQFSNSPIYSPQSVRGGCNRMCESYCHTRIWAISVFRPPGDTLFSQLMLLPLWDEGQKFNVLSAVFKNLIFLFLFKAELNGTIRILCFHRTIIDLLWPSSTMLGYSRWIIAQRKHRILMVPFNSALKTTSKNQVFKYRGQKHWTFVPHPTVNMVHNLMPSIRPNLFIIAIKLMKKQPNVILELLTIWSCLVKKWLVIGQAYITKSFRFSSPAFETRHYLHTLGLLLRIRKDLI